MKIIAIIFLLAAVGNAHGQTNRIIITAEQRFKNEALAAEHKPAADKPAARSVVALPPTDSFRVYGTTNTASFPHPSPRPRTGDDVKFITFDNKTLDGKIVVVKPGHHGRLVNIGVIIEDEERMMENVLWSTNGVTSTWHSP